MRLQTLRSLLGDRWTAARVLNWDLWWADSSWRHATLGQAGGIALWRSLQHPARQDAQAFIYYACACAPSLNAGIA